MKNMQERKNNNTWEWEGKKNEMNAKYLKLFWACFSHHITRWNTKHIFFRGTIVAQLSWPHIGKEI